MKLWLICIPPACENRRVLGPVIEMIWADFENILTFVSIDMMWINYPFLRSQISPHYLHVHLHRVSTRLNRIIALVINVSACHHWDVQDLVKNVYSNPLCVNLALYRVQNIPKTCIDADIARSAEFREKKFRHPKDHFIQWRKWTTQPRGSTYQLLLPDFKISSCPSKVASWRHE